MNGRIATVETDSFAMDYLRFGRGDEPLVILPGASVISVLGSAKAIEEAYAPLADDFDIYLLDYRRDFPESYPVTDMARDAYAALRALRLEQVRLFGASLGGMVALAMASERIGFVQKLVLGSTAPQVPESHRELFERWIELAERGDAKALFLSFGEAIYPPETFEALRGQLEATADVATADDLARFAIMMRAATDFDVTDALEDIACPVLAIGSSDDRVLGAEGTLQIAEHLKGRPGFEVHMYDGYGHAAYDTAPDYKKRMLRFLRA